MKYRNFATLILLAALLLLVAWPLAAAETTNQTVLLKVHVPFVGG
jgi:lipopolysaccharide export system protein LptC